MAYIDREKLIEKIVSTPSECCKLPQTIPFLNGSAARQNEIIDLIEAEPVYDVVGVVRCKDCEHWYCDADSGMACEFTNMSQPEDGYCNWAVRRADDECVN